ncbi:MAG: type II secretion system protein [Acidobacteriota bacterium]
MSVKKKSSQAGFSLIELLISMTVLLVLMGIAMTLFAKAMSVRTRESQTTDALTASYAALNVMSREISNSGFGLADSAGKATNGIIIEDSDQRQIHIRTNFTNVTPYGQQSQTNDPGEDVTYYFEPQTKSIVRYDANANPTTSVVVNKISNVEFKYFDYAMSGSAGVERSVPSATTGRVVITVTVQMERVQGQPNPLSISFSTEVNLRNSNYMLQQY